ncbi:c-type cytochrome [Thalassotalea profundi]|uniref:Cytochrome c, diheme subunit of cytochrome bc complex peta n=1 Tax=Thalassotalea profundi TaxID=2036687 RepID=A0ABQ3IUR5_9GAMM|nr:c-type cytochrome [Thalassotalea profundi]GHE93563.1 hypothetical protein GCM10011501_23690 [Thalassotalea profundi]
MLINRIVLITLALLSLSSFAQNVEREKLPPPRELTPEQAKVASANYQKYCSLCHGVDRQGHANDHAPSLRSKSLFESGVPHAILRPMSYGRQGTAMGGYLDEVGGPMTLDETWDLTYWLFWQAGVDRVKLSTNPVLGDVQRGEVVYQENCATCHGKKGEGITAPALGNQSALAHNSDEFIRYAIEKGRNDTPMVAFADKLSSADIDNVTAFLRSQASGWKQETQVLKHIPTPKEYIINPNNDDPNFTLNEQGYVTSADLYAALKAKKRMVLLDTRVPSVWQTAHIEGSFPLPYYTDFDALEKELPKDVQIVAYCSCPRAAADYLTNKLTDRGYLKTAVLWEGIFGWQNLGYPVKRAEGINDSKELSSSTH